MTLFKQIAILVSIIMTVLLVTVLSVNFINTSNAVQESLYEDAKNTASSLSLSLGTTGGDETFMSTMINANFDSGHYTRIALVDMDGELIYDRIKERKTSDVPGWFIHAIKIDIPTASAQVSAGWSPIGVLHVQSDSAYAYDLLYATLRELLMFFIIMAVIGLAVLSGLLHLVLRPLKSVQQQAEAIIDNEFIIQEKVPFTTEFRDVVKGMNAMVTKVEDIFEKGNKAMRHNHELLYNDPVTKLYNRRYLMMKLPLYISNDDSVFATGSIILIAFNGAQDANKTIGHQKVDELFGALGGLIQSHGDDFEEMLAARLNGTEFALLLPGCQAEEGLEIGEQICKAAEMMLSHRGLRREEGFGIYAGVYNFQRSDSISDVFANVDYALAQAKMMTLDSAYLHRSDTIEAVMGKESWREVILEGIEQQGFMLHFWPAYSRKTEALHHHVLSFSLQGSDRTHYSYGQFIAPVMSLGLDTTVYLHVLTQLIHTHNTMLESDKVAVRIPSDLFKNSEFKKGLVSLLESETDFIRNRVIFEISDKLVVENLDLVKNLAREFRHFGILFALNQFTGEAKNYDFLKEIKPLYLQSDTSFLLDQSEPSMSSLQIMTDSLGIQLMAAGVKTEEEYVQLTRRHIHLFQGPYAEKLLEQA